MKFYLFKILRLCSLIAFYFSVQTAFAGDILSNATITGITNMNANTDMVLILTSGGTGPCSSGISLSPSSFPSAKSFDRAFALLITAQVTGKKISVWRQLSCPLGDNYLSCF